MKTRAKQGQIVLLMGLMATTFVIMFGLVVSIGHLVQAKINLQNAVDLAAMSGASYQARYLNSLSEVNYRFRQNFKWTLFDLYFTQSRFNRGLQNALSGRRVAAAGNYDLMDIPLRDITFGICQQSYGYRPQPLIGEERGVQLRMNFDLCQNVVGAGSHGRGIPKFAPSPVLVPDPRIVITNLAIARLAAEAEEIFRVGKMNNPIYFEYAITMLRERQDHQLNQFKKVTEEMQQAFSDDPRALNGSQHSGDAVIVRTFRENLINANLDSEITYLNGRETRSVSLDDFEPAVVSFRMPVVIFQSRAGVFATRIEERIQNSIPGGYARKRQTNERYPQNPTMMVLKATARPKLLFWPRSLTPTISAIAAARPFGSKVGPPIKYYLDENPMALSPTANMSLYVGDTPAAAPGDKIPGIGHIRFAASVYNLLGKGVGSGVNSLRPGADGGCPRSFGCMTRAPTQYEGIMFNTFITNGSDARFDLAKTLDLGFSTAIGFNGYELKDRGKTISGIHDMRQFAGISPYYATATSALTSWAPAAALNDEGSRRIGYSIKLLSMYKACEELGMLSGGSTSGTELGFFCNRDNMILH